MKNLHDRGVISRYREYLPVTDSTPVISLNEGTTPLIYAPKLSALVGRGAEVYLKYEGLNQGLRTGSQGGYLRLDRQHLRGGSRLCGARRPDLRRPASGRKDCRG